MSFFSDLKAERLIAEIRGIGDPLHPEAQKAFQKLAKIGPGAIPKILDALAVADKKEAASYVEILTQLVDAKTFPILVQGLTDGSPRTIAAVSWALTASHNYSPSLLIELLARQDVSKPAVLEIIAAQKQRFSVRDLLQHAYSQEANEKAALFRIIAELADEASIPELISRIEGKDVLARVHIITMLSSFNLPQVSEAIQRQLKDNNKLVRQAALVALSKIDQPIAIEQVAAGCPRSADVVQFGNFGPIRTFAEYATPEQKKRWLPKLLCGEIVMSLGMTEPDAGIELRR